MIISDGFYSVYYNLWKKYFGDNILLVDGTNILKNPADEIIKIQKFLKIPVEVNQANGFAYVCLYLCNKTMKP